MLSADFALVVEGSQRYYTTFNVTVSSFSDGTPTGATALDALDRPSFTLTERMHPAEGGLDVSGLDFVLHAGGGDSITAEWTNDDDELVATYMTAELTAAATTLAVQNSAAVGALPRVVWVAGEAMLATAAPTSTTLTVTRGYLGTQARAIPYEASDAVAYEVRLGPGSATGRRVRFYNVAGGIASLRWVGYVRMGPTLSENGVSYVLQCVHAWDQEQESILAAQEPAATLAGYDALAIRLAIVINDGTIIIWARWSNIKAKVCESLRDALLVMLRRARDDAESQGATDVIPGVSQSSAGYVVKLQLTGLARGEGIITCAGETFTAQVVENSGITEYVWTIPADFDGGALVRPGFAVPGQADRATVIAPAPSVRLADWATVASGDVIIEPTLRANLSDDFALEFSATGQSTPGVVLGDTNFTEGAVVGTGSAATFHGVASIAQRDLAARSTGGAMPAATTTITSALPLYHTLRVTAPHWLDGVQAVLEDDSFVTSDSDSRNWSWVNSSVTRRATGGLTAAVEWRLSGGRTVGEFVKENAALRGACVAVREGTLTIIAVREPRPTDTPVTTLTEADYIAGTVTQYEGNSEGVVTAVTIASPVRALTVKDAVAVSRYGNQRTLEVTTDGVRNDSRGAFDPVGWALQLAGPLLTRWRKPVGAYTVTVSATLEPVVYLGAVIDFASYNAPDGSGARSFTSKRGVVIGRTEDFGEGTLTLDILALPMVYGFAPACRVATVSGAVLTIAGGYAGDAGDYAGSTLTGYRKVSGDYGTGWFAAGYKVRLILRDSATYTAESYTVSSVDTALRRIVLTSAVNTAPTNWPALVAGGSIVDVVFDSFATSVSAQRVFAAVADETTREIASGVSARRWAP